MDAATRYIIACVFSGITAVFTGLSAWADDKKKSFFFQTAQCLAYATASYFYGVYPAIVSMILCAVRNYLVAKEKYKALSAAILTSAVAVIGFLSNTSGFMGLLPVIATMEFGILLCVFKGAIASKANILVNLTLWVCYDFLVRDFINFSMDAVSCGLGVVSIVRMKKIQDRG